MVSSTSPDRAPSRETGLFKRRVVVKRPHSLAARAAAVASGAVPPPGPWQAAAKPDAPAVAEEVKAAPPVVLEPIPPPAVEPRHTLGREARLRRERAISLAADAAAPAIVTPMAEEGAASTPAAALAAAPPMPAPPEEDDTVVGSESDLELDLECSVCAEPFDVKERAPMVLPCSGSHEICALCVVALRDRFGGDDGAFHCPSCREPILPCFPINKNRGLMAALRLNERLARRRR